MNLKLVNELTDYLDVKCRSVLVHGYAMPEIEEAVGKQGLALRIIHPKEFSLPAIHEVQRKNLLADRSDPTVVGFWTGLRQTLRISNAVQVLVFQDIEQLDERHAAALESALKGDMDHPEDGSRFKYIWATSASLPTYYQEFMRVVPATPA